MIFIHLLLGILLGQIFGNYFLFILGSIIPDIDHLYVAIKNGLLKQGIFLDSIRFEKRYKIKYKTPLVHSLLGLIIFSAIVFLFVKWQVIYFSIAYFLHLLADWPDVDEKYYLYPLKIKFKGPLKVFSNPEKIITLALMLLIILFLIY